jgi:hypothetical protein
MSPLLPVDEGAGLDETVPLLRQTAPSHDGIPTRITRRLYVSHFLSTWNTRVFEFGAVLYLASIFPGTLLPMSVYALTRGLSAILFAPAVGQYIDSGNRLQVVRVSIGKHSYRVSVCVRPGTMLTTSSHGQYISELQWQPLVQSSTSSASNYHSGAVAESACLYWWYFWHVLRSYAPS